MNATDISDGNSKSRPLSIFLLARSLETGGAERQLVQLAIGLKQRGHPVHVGVFYKRGPLIDDLERNSVPIVDLGKKGRWDLLRFAFRVRGVVTQAKADVLYSFLGGANIVGAAVRILLPRLKLAWSIRASDMDLTRYDWVHRAGYRVECALSRLPDLIIANSNTGRSFAIANGFPGERIEVVPNGIDTDRFRPDADVRARQREQWGLGAHDIAIGIVARFDPMKGHETFIRAAVSVAARLPNAKFICVGEGSEERRIQQLAAHLGLDGRLLFTGRSDDPVSALNGLDICCSSSAFGEGFSNSIAEAMACGLPCVVTDVGDSAGIVADDGVAVPRDDPDALAAALIAQAKGLDRHDPMRPRRRIMENFSLDEMVERTLRLIESAVLSNEHYRLRNKIGFLPEVRG